MTDSAILEDEVLHIDENKTRKRFPDVVYSLFVDAQNMQNDISMPLTNIRDNFKTEALNTGNQESYTLNLSSQVNYSAWAVRELDVTLNVTGVKYSQNRFLDQQIYSAAPDTFTRDFTGLPHPYLPGIFGTVCDPLNSMLSSTAVQIGSNNQEVPINLTPKDVDVHRRMSDYNVITDGRYQGLLMSETVNLDVMQLNANKKVVMPFDILLEQWNRPQWQNQAALVCYPYFTGEQAFLSRYIASKNAMTLDQVNADPLNRLSLFQRGQIFKNAIYGYSKAELSPNYKINFTKANLGTANVYASVTTDVLSTTTLHTMIIGDYQLPTNVTNWDECLQNGISPYTLMWYYNKNPLAFLTGGTAEATTYSYPPGYPEPASQSLNITITFPKLQSPLINPLFNEQYVKSFTNCMQANVIAKYNTDIEKKLLRIIGRAGSTLTVNGSLNQPNQFAASIVNTNVDGLMALTFSGQRLYYRQCQAGLLQSDTKSVTVLPYMFRKQFPKSIQTRIQESKIKLETANWRSFESQLISSDNIPIGGNVPRYFKLDIDCPITALVEELSITFNGGNVQLLTMASLREATIRNGMRHYSALDEQGYNVLSNATASGYTIVETPKYDRFLGRGTILLLEFGRDISLPEGIVAGMTGVDVSIQYQVKISFPDEYVGTDPAFTVGTSISGQLNIEHLSEADFTITENVGGLVTELLTPPKVAEAISQMKARISRNLLYVNKRKLYSGAGFVSDAFHKARQILPKMVSAYNTGKKIVHGAVKALETGQQALHKVQRVGATLADYMR